jgi:hypothetical protein
MASIIKIKRNNTGGTVPSGGDLAAGELAVNTADGLLFTSSNGSDIVSLGQTSASIQEAAALANTNSRIGTVESATTTAAIQATAALANTNSRIGTVESATTTAAIQATAALANTNAYIADVKTDSASWNDDTDTITFTRGDSTTYSVALTGFPSDSVSNTYVQLLLSNTNTFIGTKLDSSSYTTADVQTKAALANTNTFIGTKLDSSSYTTADVQVKAALANTNSYIADVQADVDQNEADADAAISNLIDGTTAFTGIDVNGGNIDGATIATSDVTVGSGKTLNVSAGTLTLADNQISGDKVDGGTISNFASTGIDDNATSTKITVADATTTIANDLTVSGALTVDGNLNVEGTVTYIGTTTVNVEDSMMKLSANNSGDAIDTGVYGKYVDGSTTKYAGYFRDATDETVKFFTGLEVEPTGTVNTAGAGYALATVEAVIDGGTF